MILEGKLFFYSETGTEGGYWAFQDNSCISLNLPSFGITNDTRVWDAGDRNKTGQASDAELFLDDKWVSLPDPITLDPDYELSSLFCGERRGDRSADQRLMKRYGFLIKYTNQGGGTPTTEPKRPFGIPQNGLTRVTVKWANGEVEFGRRSDTLLVEHWDYKGLHILKNGDSLQIIDPIEKSVVWEGVVELKSYGVFTEHARGFWIHADQMGISREDWSRYFFENYHARLLI